MSPGNLARKSLPEARGERADASGLQAAAQPAAASEPEQPATKPRRRRVVLAALGLALAAGGGSYYWANRNIESTDDAQVDAELVAVAARSGGTVLAVHFGDNQAVKQGQLLAEIDDAP
ncbi:MAG TPA: biotin/lipoyl-binding protein, partial [Polyangiales bacterium]|nr:biotin/lipoyl-binding protein [Polyangiales bacterium]